MNIWRPYTQMQTSLAPIHLRSANGAYLYTEDGRTIFDGISSWWLTNHGHAHPHIVQAISEQAKTLEQAVFANFTNDPAEKFARKLKSFLPNQLNQLFFSDNGSTAVEVAMKMAYQSRQQIGQSHRKKFVSFTHAYHGDTCGAMSVSGDSAFTKPYQSMRFDVIRCKQGLSVNDSVDVWLSDFEACLFQKQNEICAVLIEPLIQGAGGMIVWPIDVIKKICAIAKSHGILLIFDEVMTGFGRTGTMFAFEQLKIVPDFLCLSKSLTGGFLPMGLTVTTSSVYEHFLSDSTEKMFFHGHSFTGNALSCAAALANLEIFEKENTLEKIKYIQSSQTEILQSLQHDFPEIEARVCGTIGVVQIKSPSQYGSLTSKKIHTFCMERGVFIRPLGSTIYVMPPYCSTAQDLKFAWKVISQALSGL